MSEYCKAVEELKPALDTAPLEEKWIIVPIQRIGQQWIDALTRGGSRLLNTHILTPVQLALKFAAAKMAEDNLSLLRGCGQNILAAQIFCEVRKERESRQETPYLTKLAPSQGLSQTLAKTLNDLRLAGIDPATLVKDRFEDETKGDELVRMLTLWNQKLETSSRLDRAELFRLAAACIKTGKVPVGQTIIMAADHLTAQPHLFKELWAQIPEASRRELPGDLSESDASSPGGALDRVFGSLSGDAVSLRRAVGEINEVRQVLRHCLAGKIPFEEVEIIHSCGETYIPLIFETMITLLPKSSADLPVTFAEGIPSRYSKPGKALSAWLALVEAPNKVPVLSRMIRDNLLQAPDKETDHHGAREKAGQAVIRCCPAGTMAELKTSLESALGHAEDAAKATVAADNELDPEKSARRAQALQAKVAALKDAHAYLTLLLSITPDTTTDPAQLLEGAQAFLKTAAKATNQMDTYSAEGLVKAIEEFAALLPDGEVPPGVDVQSWLKVLPAATSVLGKSPGPGCLHVSSLHDGGYSGRGHTFILGLDDGRFPGANLQDAMLLDNEREGISTTLPTSSGLMKRKLAAFNQLLARLRGTVTLSYSCRSLSDNREQFPSPNLIAICRHRHNLPDADSEVILKQFGEPVSFAPAPGEGCISMTEWWLQRLVNGSVPQNIQELMAECFPHLDQGMTAAAARASDRFTEYDGYVPEAGLDPTADGAPTLSASRLETLARLPLEYFFTYVLGIRLEDEYKDQQEGWLGSADLGTMAHGILCRFMRQLTADGTPIPVRTRDEAKLVEMMETALEEERRINPPLTEPAFEKSRMALLETVQIFLTTEEDFCRDEGFEPCWFEAAIGMDGKDGGTEMDSADPAELELTNGKKLKLRGQIDRIDKRVGTAGTYALWDYKTGGTYAYDQRDAFKQGRLLQSILYLAMADKILKKKFGSTAKAEHFGYFFPGQKGEGERYSWSRCDLWEKGVETVSLLCQMIENGCFPPSKEENDYFFSNFNDAMGGVEAAMDDAARKLENPLNWSTDTLDPYHKLTTKGEPK